MPKIAIVSLINQMKRNGYSDEFIDFYDIDMLLPDDEEIERHIREFRPEVVGLSAVVSTCYSQVKRISNIIKNVDKNILIVLGGTLSASSDLILRKTEVDICVVGDGENTWTELLAVYESSQLTIVHAEIENIIGLAFLDTRDELKFTGYGKPIDPSLNPFPDYRILLSGLKGKEYEIDNYFRPGLGCTHFRTDPRSFEPGRRPMLAQLWTSKGCVARCTFCQRTNKGYKTHDLVEFESHLKDLQLTHNVGYIHILDENFGSDIDYARAVAALFNDYNMLWMASGIRVTSLTESDIAFFKQNGCSSLKFGVESGSQDILNIMEKKFTVDKVYETLSYCNKYEIYSPLAVMVGMPGETIKTASQTGEFVGRLSYMQGLDPIFQGVSVFYALPLNGTPLYAYGQAKGVIGSTPDDEERFILSISGTGANKTNYINLNGAPIDEVIMWDHLVMFEARRTYLTLCQKNGPPPETFLSREIVSSAGSPCLPSVLELFAFMSNNSFKTIGSALFFSIERVVVRWLLSCDRVVLIPREILYPSLNILLRVNHILQGIIVKYIYKKNYNLWRPWPHVDRFEAKKKSTQAIDVGISLRKVVRKDMGIESDGSTKQKMSLGM